MTAPQPTLRLKQKGPPRLRERPSQNASAAALLGTTLQRLHLAVLAPVGEVDHQPDHQPDKEPQPVGPAEAVDHRTADDHARGRDERNRRDSEGPRQIRTPATQDPDSDAYQHKG